MTDVDLAGLRTNESNFLSVRDNRYFVVRQGIAWKHIMCFDISDRETSRNKSKGAFTRYHFWYLHLARLAIVKTDLIFFFES